MEAEQIRKAVSEDVPAVFGIYEKIHELERQKKMEVGWLPGVYPSLATAEEAQKRGDLFVYEEDGQILAAAIINQSQVDVYAKGSWKYPARESQVMVLHTLVVDPDAGKRGIGSHFVAYYEAYALKHGCPALRMDTNAKNKAARTLYKKLGYREAGIVPCVFNGIPDVPLVLLEKHLEANEQK